MDVEEWLATNGGLLYKAAKPYLHRGVEYDDIMQEANIAAVIAIRKYDESRQWSLSSFVFFCVQRHLQDVVRKAANEIRAVSLDEMAESDAEYLHRTNRRSSPVESEVERNEFTRNVIEFGERRTNPMEKDMIHAMLSGEVSREVSRIAEKHHIAVRSVWYRKSKLQGVLIEEFADWLPSMAAI